MGHATVIRIANQMQRFKRKMPAVNPVNGHRLSFAVATFCMLGLPFSSVSLASAAPTTVTLNVTVYDKNAGQQDAVRVTDLNNNVLGICQLSSTNKVRKTACAIQVPMNKSVILAASSPSGERLASYAGSGCASAPGPVCHIAIYTSNQSVSTRFGTAQLGPSVTTAKPLVYAGSPTLSLAGIGYAGFANVQVSGSGFLANTPAALTDDGITVATGTTDGSGSVNLNYTAASEPGIYRALTIQAGNQIATTDVYNTLVWSWGEGNQGSGNPFFVINETNMDANKVENYVQFDNNTPVPITFTDGSASQGYAQVQTPPYACAAGMQGTLSIYGARGTGLQRYTYKFTFTVTC